MGVGEAVTNLNTFGDWANAIIFTNPYYAIAFVFAFLAGLAFLVFLRGFLSGLPHIFTLSSHDEHQAHHRVRITWGLMMLIALFIVWQIIRSVAGFLGSLT